MLTRFAAMVVVSDVLRQQGGKFPKGLRQALSENIKRPAFGGWKQIVTKACANLLKDKGRAQCFVMELPDYVTGPLLRCLGGGREDEPTRHIIALRNMIAHCGRLSAAQAQGYLDQHQRRFEDLMAKLEFLTGYDLLSCAAEGPVLSLRGLPKPDGEFPLYESSQFKQVVKPDRVLLVKGSHVLDLFPLHSFSEVTQWRDEKEERVADAAPQVYFRLSDSYLEFIPLTEGPPVSQKGGYALKRFRELFPLEEWRRWTEAERQLAELSEVFVGRDAEVAEANGCLERHETGVLWISGKPGVGKSALMARMVRDLQGLPNYVVVPYFFRIGRAGCSTDLFLKAALLHLHGAMSEVLPPAPTPEGQRQQFVEAVSRASAQLDRKVLFLIDGLDEINRIDSSFVSLLFAASAPRVVWLCAGRSEPSDLEQALERGKAQWVFPEGLPPMGEQAVRALLTDLVRLKYKLFDRDKKRGEQWHNRFIEVLVRKSEGLPLYVRMLMEDLCVGKWTLEDEARLPDGLIAYFDQILERLRVSDVGSVLAPLFCLLVWAKEPVIESALKLLLSDLHLAKRPGWNELFQTALERGHLMLRRAPTPEGASGWTFYHDSFREHLLKSGIVRENREWAKEAWLNYGQRWRAPDDAYPLRWFPAHLFEAGASEELITLLRKNDFLEVKVQRLKDPFLAAQDVCYLCLSLLATGRDEEIAEFALAEPGYRRDGVSWGLREGWGKEPELAPRIKSVVETLLVKEGSGKPSAIRHWIRLLRPRRRASAAVINARLVAIDVAYHLDLDDVLARAARDRSEIVRGLLPSYLYRFWKKRPEDGWRLLERLGSSMFGIGGLPDRRLLEACGGMSLAILMHHSDEPKVLEDLRRRWQDIVRRVSHLGPLLKAAMYILTRNFRWLMKKQADYQPINLTELSASYSRPGEAQRLGLQVLQDLAEPARGVNGTVEILLQRDLPFDVYLMLVAERTLVFHGSRGPGQVMVALYRLHREGCRWFRQSALYTAFHALRRADRVENAWLEWYGQMTRETVQEERGTYSTGHGRYTLVPHMAWAEMVFQQHRPQGRTRFIPEFFTEAIQLRDYDYASRALQAAGVLALAYQRFDLALDTLRGTLDVQEPREELVKQLANIRFYNEAFVDQFLEQQGATDLKLRVTAATPTVSSLDIPTWIDDFMVSNMIRSDSFRAEVIGAFQRAGHARSPDEVLQQVLKWGMDLIEGKQMVIV
jgi:hypothetical protein